MKSISPLLALMLTACVSTTEPGAQGLLVKQVYAGTSKADIWQAVMESLEANDLPVVAADFERGKIRARQHNYLDGRWAACPNLDSRSFDPLSPINLGIRAGPLYRGVDLRLEISGTETGTRLSLDPRYYNVGRDDGRREYALQVRCRSTGVLEQTLFTAAGTP